jgi:hypothetical protein
MTERAITVAQSYLATLKSFLEGLITAQIWSGGFLLSFAL